MSSPLRYDAGSAAIVFADRPGRRLHEVGRWAAITVFSGVFCASAVAGFVAFVVLVFDGPVTSALIWSGGIVFPLIAALIGATAWGDPVRVEFLPVHAPEVVVVRQRMRTTELPIGALRKVTIEVQEVGKLWLILETEPRTFRFGILTADPDVLADQLRDLLSAAGTTVTIKR